MNSPAIPTNEAARLQALRDLAILDTESEERFDRLTRLARQIFAVPYALISLIDDKRQWFKSKQGLDICETSREISFCAHAILSEDILYIPDAQQDERFAENPGVTGSPYVRFYAGYPLKTRDGFVIGTLCILDQKPRELDADQLQSLRDLGRCVEDQIAHLRSNEMAQSFYDQEVYLNAILSTVKDGIISIDEKGIIQTVNRCASSLFGYTPDEMVGHNVSILMHDDAAQLHDQHIQQYLSSGYSPMFESELELTGRRKDGSSFPLQIDLEVMQQRSGLSHFVAIVRDIESIKNKETSYRQARDRLKHLLSATDGIIFACQANPQLDTIFVSDNVTKVMGYIPSDFLKDKQFWQQHLHPDDREWVFERFRILKENLSINMAFRMRHVDGDYRWLHANLQLLDTRENDRKEIVGLLTDITGQKRIQDEINRNHHLLNAISRAQSQFISDANINIVFNQLLHDLLQLTESKYGLIAEVRGSEVGLPYLKTFAMKYITRGDDIRARLEEEMFMGVEFQVKDSLVGEVIKTGDSVIVNDYKNDPRPSGLPKEHLPLETFLGLPFYLGNKIIGMIGLANRKQGYNQNLIDFLQPLLKTSALMIQSLRNETARRQTTRELNRFKETLDHTLDMIFMFDSETLRFEYLNDGAVQSMGYSREELLQMTPIDIRPELSEAEFREFILPLRLGELSSLSFEARHRRKNGEDFPVEIFLQLVHENKDKARFIAIVRDISERRQAEQENLMYTTALEKLHQINTDSRLGLSARVLAILSLGCDIFGLPMGIVSHVDGEEYRVDYIVGEGEIPEPGALFELNQTYCAETLRQNRPVGYHSVAKSELASHPCYQKFSLEAYLGTPLYVGKELYGTLNFSSSEPQAQAFSSRQFSLMRVFAQWIGSMLEEERINAELHNATQLRQAILDSANFSIIATDIHGIINMFNSGAQRLLGYSEEEVVGKTTPQIIHDSSEVIARANILSQELGRTIEPGFEVFVAKCQLGIADENEWTYIRKDGSRFPVQLSVTALHDKHNQITGYLGIAKDITEHKRIERMKNEFVSTVSHELRTPLTSIKGALSLVLRKSANELSAKAIKMLETASRNSERLTLLINDILDLDRIESGRMQFELENINLLQAAEQALESNESYAQHHQVQLCLNHELDEAYVLADGHRLQQVFANLLSNAIKFSQAHDQVIVTITRQGEKYRVGILDHGRGIPEDFHDRIFQRFAQADSSDTRDKGGTGLGLSISHAIVEHMGGQINFSSREGIGTEFYFLLPASNGLEQSNKQYTSRFNHAAHSD